MDVDARTIMLNSKGRVDYKPKEVQMVLHHVGIEHIHVHNNNTLLGS